MNKGELVEIVAAELGQTKASASRAVEAVLHGITGGLRSTKSVTLTGFGTFVAKSRLPRVGRNPITGQQMTIPESRTVRFRPSPALKHSI